MTKLHYAVRHLMSSLIWTNHQKILKNPLPTEWIFQGYFFFGFEGWCTDETYVAEVQAVVEQHYLPKVPVPVQHMAIFYHSVAEPDRNVLKLQFKAM